MDSLLLIHVCTSRLITWSPWTMKMRTTFTLQKTVHSQLKKARVCGFKHLKIVGGGGCGTRDYLIASGRGRTKSRPGLSLWWQPRPPWQGQRAPVRAPSQSRPPSSTRSRALILPSQGRRASTFLFKCPRLGWILIKLNSHKATCHCVGLKNIARE